MTAIEAASCTACPLAATRNRVVWGENTARPVPILLVGEAPGRYEDKEGRPFVGQAGKLLTSLLERAGLDRSMVGITNRVRCVVGSTPIAAPSAVTAGYRRYYEGPIVSIKTANGAKLTITPNHPVLTQRGWVSAKDINPEADFVKTLVGRSADIWNPVVDDMTATAEQVFNALQGEWIHTRIVGSTVDFHGDGVSDSEVEVVLVNRNLGVNLVPTPYEFGFNGAFTLIEPSDLTGVSKGSPRLPAALNRVSAPFATDSGSCLSCEIATVGSAKLSPVVGQHRWLLPAITSDKSLAVGSNSDASPPQPTRYSGVTDSDLVGYLDNRKSRGIQLDKVIGVNVHSWSGHVYNFSTDEGWYISDSIITHNCRPPENRDPTPQEREACRLWLEEEVSTARPAIIVLLGISAATWAHPMGKPKMAELRGKLKMLTVGEHQAISIVTYHPAAALRQGEVVERLIVADLVKAREMSTP